ncbi:uncharacterized protein LOC141995528 [Natator depressus]|uniref:uncharacterized protein LOC141995528 n=1 Tax=Natator depressus TaxID=27790 RepID=UPI003EBA09A9
MNPKGLCPSVEKVLHQQQFQGGGGSDRGEPFGPAVDGTPEPKPETQLSVGHPDEHGGLLSSTPVEEEGERSSGESPADKLDDAFLEAPEALDSVASSSEDEPGPPCFCPTPIQIVEEDSEDDSYEEFRRRLGMELTEPLPRRERKKAMRTIVRVAVSAVLNHCLREKLFEDCEGCVIDTPAQRHHDCVTWTSVDKTASSGAVVLSWVWKAY